jgi:hypothetical protein
VNISPRLQSAWQRTNGFLLQHGSTTTSISSLALVFLPFDPTEYPQAPYQTLTEEQYNEWVQKMPESIDWTRLSEYEVKITQQEAKNWLVSEGYVRCKEIASDVIFEAMLWEDAAVILREVSSDPHQLYIVSIDVFADKFSAIGD